MSFFDVVAAIALAWLAAIAWALVGPVVLLLAKRRPGRFAGLMTGVGVFALALASIWLGATLPDAFVRPDEHHDSDNFGSSSASNRELALWALLLWMSALGGRWLGLRWRRGSWPAAATRLAIDSATAVLLVAAIAFALWRR